jgi:ribosome maturation factor RimP
MNEAQQIEALEQMVESLLENEPGFFLVEIKITQGNNVKVFVDADQGAAIDKLVQINRGLYKRIEEKGIFLNGNFSLEVSSPGLEEPLKLQRQYLKNIGRYIEVLKKDGIKVEGKLLNVSEKEIVVEEEKKLQKKKTELLQHTIPFELIKTTKIQIKF